MGGGGVQHKEISGQGVPAEGRVQHRSHRGGRRAPTFSIQAGDGSGQGVPQPRVPTRTPGSGGLPRVPQLSGKGGRVQRRVLKEGRNGKMGPHKNKMAN